MERVGNCLSHGLLTHRCLHTDDEFFLKSMRDAIHEILTDVSDSFSNMIDMALANEIQVCKFPAELNLNFPKALTWNAKTCLPHYI